MTMPQEHIKRALDVLISLAALIILSPFFALIAIAIRMDSRGVILFCQKRLGRHGVPFTLYKFRTMVENAPDFRNADGSTFNSAYDARVTAIGAFLRKTSLDELPQLLNILGGDMSLVGPRPDLVDQKQYYTGDEWRRNLVKPGITGLAQTKGRNAICWAERKQMDLEYVDNQSIKSDLQILMRTIPYVLLSRDIHIQAEVETTNFEAPSITEVASELAG
jgi:undecaprenyl phosphate N,N'-diacetylbacillosamine 1-phosphate transferase